MKINIDEIKINTALMKIRAVSLNNNIAWESSDGLLFDRSDEAAYNQLRIDNE